MLTDATGPAVVCGLTAVGALGSLLSQTSRAIENVGPGERGASALTALQLLQSGTRPRNLIPTKLRAGHNGISAPGPAPSVSGQLTISIPRASTRVVDSAGPESSSLVTEYEVYVDNGGNGAWTVRHRYNDFRMLLADLMKRHDRLELSFLPALPRRYRDVRKNEPHVVAARREALQLFLRAAVSLPRVATNEAFLEFIGYEETTHDSVAIASLRQRQVTEIDAEQMGRLHRAGSAVMMADLAEETPPNLQGKLMLRSVHPQQGETSEYSERWCELRGPNLSYMAVQGGDMVEIIHLDEAMVLEGVPPSVATKHVDVFEHCFTVTNAVQNQAFVFACADEDARIAWVSTIHAQLGELSAANEDVLHGLQHDRAGSGASRRERMATTDGRTDVKTMGDELLVALQLREEQEAAKRRMRRQTFLLEDSFLSGIEEA